MVGVIQVQVLVDSLACEVSYSIQVGQATTCISRAILGFMHEAEDGKHQSWSSPLAALLIFMTEPFEYCMHHGGGSGY
jgi:hypothetical protein